MENQEKLVPYPYFEIRGTVKITEDNTCDFEPAPDTQIPEEEGIMPFIGEFNLDGTNETYRRIDLFCMENGLTEETLKENFDAKGEDAAKYLITIDQVTFIRKDFLN